MRGKNMVTGKRKNFTVSLDPDETAYVQEHLSKQGITLSGFFRAAIAEFKDNLVLTDGKSFKDMSVTEFLKVVESFGEKMKENEGKDKEVEKQLKV